MRIQMHGLVTSTRFTMCVCVSMHTRARFVVEVHTKSTWQCSLQYVYIMNVHSNPLIINGLCTLCGICTEANRSRRLGDAKHCNDSSQRGRMVSCLS